MIQSNLMQLHKSLGGSAASTTLARWDEYLKSPTALIEEALSEHQRKMDWARGQLGVGLRGIADQYQELLDASRASRSVETALRSFEGHTLQHTIDALRGQSLDYFASEGLAGATRTIARHVQFDGEAVVSMTMSCDAVVIQGDEVELERQMVRSLQADQDLSTWPDAAQLKLNQVLYLLISLMAAIPMQSAVRQELCFYQPKLVPLATANQVGRSVRAFLCETGVPIEYARVLRTVERGQRPASDRPKHESRNCPGHAPGSRFAGGSRQQQPRLAVRGLEGWISRKYTRQLLR